MDTSGLTGAPAPAMLNYTCFGMSSLEAHDFHLGSGITFTSANVNSLNSAFRMSNWTGQVYWGEQLLTDAIPIPDARTYTFYSAVNMPGYADIDINWK